MIVYRNCNAPLGTNNVVFEEAVLNNAETRCECRDHVIFCYEDKVVFWASWDSVDFALASHWIEGVVTGKLNEIKFKPIEDVYKCTVLIEDNEYYVNSLVYDELKQLQEEQRLSEFEKDWKQTTIEIEKIFEIQDAFDRIEI